MTVMTNIADNIRRIEQQLPQGVRLVAVSKYHPVEMLRQAYEAGQRVFGENHVQELVAKAPQLPSDIQWHMIGHLQTNKVRALMPHVSMIQSIDSIKLLRTVEKEAARIGRTVDVLLQLHVAQETTKTGFAVPELQEALSMGEFDNIPHVRVRGLMAMATNTDDQAQIEREFQHVKDTFGIIRQKYYIGRDEFDQISMGMSDDWPLAVKHGATLVRVGSAIFGPRQY